MVRAVVFLLLSWFILSFAKPPAPFGLELGKTTEKEFLKVVKQKGWNIEKSGYRIIEADITNPDVTGYAISGINLDKLSEAVFWFYKGTLFKIVYTFSEDMQKNTFYLYFDQLKAKYGKPSSYRKPWLSDGEAVWRFGNVKLELYCPWVGRSTYILYVHTPLDRKAEKSDEAYYRKYIREKSKKTEGL
ncbi:hypothetical protein [Hydrogenivirga sp. 128-5-R1-1]|uniref:hypothetical protein n=1 Tax=Hydrogenivirga sp. 128-5-R1-1 TaxID=392423 RepID=UPI00015F0C5B|nr:hypothetical protein [Hydrogenivirga sp. 128-5-R1-1]EDP75970.1 hypothetical protein HG1285_06575 [Hydrogenivirga sp. 128-5-R1-1]